MFARLSSKATVKIKYIRTYIYSVYTIFSLSPHPVYLDFYTNSIFPNDFSCDTEAPLSSCFLTIVAQ